MTPLWLRLGRGLSCVKGRVYGSGMTLREEIRKLHNDNVKAHETITGEHRLGQSIQMENETIWNAIFRLAEYLDERERASDG